MQKRQGKVDVPLAIVSLILGVATWLYAVNIQHKKLPMEKDLRIDAPEPPEGFVATKFPSSLRVAFRGTKEELDGITDRDLKNSFAWIDMRGAEEGTHSYPVRFELLGNLERLERTSLRAVDVTLARTVVVAKQVEVAEFGESPNGLRYDASAVMPSSVDLEGTPEDLARVSRVRVLLDLSKAEIGNTQRLPVSVIDKNGKVLSTVLPSPGVVSVIPAFSASVPTKSVMVSPKFIGTLPAGLRLSKVEVTPNQVAVRGERKLLSGLFLVSTAAINLSSIQASTVLPVELQLPPGIKTSGVAKITVRVTVEPVAEPPSMNPSGPP
ncbi:MAG: hypothetical protein HZC36_02955 [Armatimonadetes bacterium]|nr:hypothetical protein [Armatimonadota bacterium]